MSTFEIKYFDDDEDHSTPECTPKNTGNVDPFSFLANRMGYVSGKTQSTSNYPHTALDKLIASFDMKSGSHSIVPRTPLNKRSLYS